MQDECVTDRLTGLVWSQNADRLNDLVGWQSALDHAGGLSLCGYDDWRLPNRKELWSLVNHQVADPAAWLESQGFSNVHYQPEDPLGSSRTGPPPAMSIIRRRLSACAWMAGTSFPS